MPQPPISADTAARLAAVFTQAQADLLAELATVVNDPVQASRTARIETLIANVEAMAAHLDDEARTWLEGPLVDVYGAGAAKAADAVGTVFQWSGHEAAVQALVNRDYGAIAAGLQDLTETSRATLRELASDAGRAALLQGETAVQAGVDLASAAQQAGIGTVTYSNGARVPVEAWAETVSRTQTAEAYNAGTITQGRGDGFTHVLIEDGDGCGWLDHDDPDLANGTVRTIDDWEANPISHPNCARSGTPVPADTPDDTTPDERAAAASIEQQRAASATTTLSGHARGGRTPRTPRSGRVSRI